MHAVSGFLLAMAALLPAAALAQIVFYEHDGYQGRSFSSEGAVANFKGAGFNDRTSSVVVERGEWELCTDANFGGRCMVLRRGAYPSMSSLGMNDAVSSVRPAEGRRLGRQDDGERRYSARPPLPGQLYPVPVVSVHPMEEPAQRRCWVERERVPGAPADERDVQRCQDIPARVLYYKVSYYWQGHARAGEMSRPPGPTILVDAEGNLRQ